MWKCISTFMGPNLITMSVQYYARLPMTELRCNPNPVKVTVFVSEEASLAAVTVRNNALTKRHIILWWL